jgi:hypothetical protein
MKPDGYGSEINEGSHEPVIPEIQQVTDDVIS